MGRHAKVPVKTGNGNKIVSKNRVGNDSNTPYRPADINYQLLGRMGFDEVPSFADE